MTRPPDGVRRVRGYHLPDDKPVEQHPNASQMLLDRGSRTLTLQKFDMRGNMHRLSMAESAKPLQEPRAAAHGFLHFVRQFFLPVVLLGRSWLVRLDLTFWLQRN